MTQVAIYVMTCLNHLPIPAASPIPVVTVFFLLFVVEHNFCPVEVIQFHPAIISIEELREMYVIVNYGHGTGMDPNCHAMSEREKGTLPDSSNATWHQETS